MCSFREVKRLYPRSQYGQVSSWENASGVPTQDRQGNTLKYKFQTYYYQETCFTFIYITVRKHAVDRSSICFRKGTMIFFFQLRSQWLLQHTLEIVSSIRSPKTTPLSESVGLLNTALEPLYICFC